MEKQLAKYKELSYKIINLNKRNIISFLIILCFYNYIY